MNLKTPIKKTPKISDKYAKRLENLGIKNLGDLLFHFPHRYEDFSSVVKIKKARGAEPKEKVCVRGRVARVLNERTAKKRMTITKAFVKDETGLIPALWFNQPYLEETFQKKEVFYFAGPIKVGKNGPFLSNPIHEREKKEQIHTARLVPVYPETEGVSSRWLRYVLFPLVKEISPRMPETLPSEIIKKENLYSFKKALKEIHFPESKKTKKEAVRRFSFEELFLLELKMLRSRRKVRQKKSWKVNFKKEEIKKFVKSLPFTLTDSQKRAAWEILKDMEEESPMARLLQGDVGSGKTITAAIAALNTARNDFQTALMAPTEILAHQHFQKLSRFFKNTNVSTGLLTGSKSRVAEEGKILKTKKQGFLKMIKEGRVDIVVGTHALIQKGVSFSKLAFVVIDEQHRFGVKQRKKLREKGSEKYAHFLSMTATPIPRSLGLTIYGDLDISTIDEMPHGERKVRTVIVPQKERGKIYEFVKSEVKKGRQAFIIFPRISLDEKTDVKSIEENWEFLSKKVFPGLKVKKIHGQVDNERKEKTMKKFSAGEIDILLSTSIIEVGIDVPRASVMIIEGAERFGLAQLHQLRGRIGRSNTPSHCFLFPTSEEKRETERLRALVETNDGFKLAEKDLQIRGVGDFLGQRQSGKTGLMMASLGDLKMVKKARKRAQEILKKSPSLNEYLVLKKRLKRFSKNVHLE